MKAGTRYFLPLICVCPLLQAEGIDLGCEDLAKQMIERLDNEGLLVNSAGSDQRARQISLELCAGAEETAQQQHEVGKQNALKNWFSETTGGKPGNERLKRFGK